MSRLVLKLALLCALAAAVADARGARAGRDQNGRSNSKKLFFKKILMGEIICSHFCCKGVLPSRRTTITNKDGRQEDIELCTTPECVVAGDESLDDVLPKRQFKVKVGMFCTFLWLSKVRGKKFLTPLKDMRWNFSGKKEKCLP